MVLPKLKNKHTTSASRREDQSAHCSHQDRRTGLSRAKIDPNKTLRYRDFDFDRYDTDAPAVTERSLPLNSVLLLFQSHLRFLSPLSISCELLHHNPFRSKHTRRGRHGHGNKADENYPLRIDCRLQTDRWGN